MHGNIGGNNFPNENRYTSMFDMYFKEGIYGEKIIVFKTEVRKKYKHELEDGERFITEARMYHKMDLKYKVKCFNIVLVGGDYLESGYTANINKIFKNNPKGYFKYFSEILERNTKGMLLNKRIYVLKHYILFSYIINSKNNLKNIKSFYNKILYIILIIPGRLKSKFKIKKGW